MALRLKEIPFKNGEKLIEAIDEARGLRAYIGIHNTELGPALGGTRIYPYQNAEDAIFDVCRLAEGMSYKSALAGTGFGGGKSVIIADPKTQKTADLLKAFAEAVHALEGIYICAEDVGSTCADMMVIRGQTPYVAGLPIKGGSGDPGRFTAFGIYQGLRAVAQKLWGSPSLLHKTVAIQGLGSVGARVAEFLFWEGAYLILSDIDKAKAEKLAEQFHGKVAAPEDILSVKCDILCPCAMGGIINEKTIDKIDAEAVAGAANNQLLDMVQDGKHLLERGILYAPDYVLNAGGVINVAHEMHKDSYSTKRVLQDIAKIKETLLDIFTMAEQDQQTTSYMALQLAKQKIADRIGKREGKPFFPPCD